MEKMYKFGWAKKYFGHTMGSRKHGVGSIVYNDGARFHGMMMDD